MQRRNIPTSLHLPIMDYMLKAFADRLMALEQEPSVSGRLIVVNTQGTLRPNSKKDWSNEIHPTSQGFKKIYKKIYKKMKSINANLP